jgi:hypothetical protein
MSGAVDRESVVVETARHHRIGDQSELDEKNKQRMERSGAELSDKYSTVEARCGLRCGRLAREKLRYDQGPSVRYGTRFKIQGRTRNFVMVRRYITVTYLVWYLGTLDFKF